MNEDGSKRRIQTMRDDASIAIETGGDQSMTWSSRTCDSSTPAKYMARTASTHKTNSRSAINDAANIRNGQHCLSTVIVWRQLTSCRTNTICNAARMKNHSHKRTHRVSSTSRGSQRICQTVGRQPRQIGARPNVSAGMGNGRGCCWCHKTQLPLRSSHNQIRLQASAS